MEQKRGMIRTQTKDFQVPVGKAAFPAPFANVLEFNSPAHGTWNIVHMGMQVPEAHQIYVCAYNCMRGVVLTAAEMNLQDRFSFVILDEEDMIAGKLEDITIEGVASCLEKMEKKPPVVLLFTVCVHQFLGCDLDYIYRKLGERFPDIFFARCFMDCLLQKKGPTPDMKLRRSMYDPIQPKEMEKGMVSFIGSDIPFPAENEVYELVSACGGTVKQMGQLKDYADFQTIGASEIIVTNYPAGVMGAENLAERLGRKFLYLPMTFDYAEIRKQREMLAELLPVKPDEAKEYFDVYLKMNACEVAADHAFTLIGDRPITIDYTFHPRPLGLAKYLIEHGFTVEAIYLDAILPEEKHEFEWLAGHCPKLPLISTMKPEMRVLKRNRPDILAIGQKAAWFAGTKHFVDGVQGAGLYGFDGILTFFELLEEAHLQEKDTKDRVIRKGWGCESCIS